MDYGNIWASLHNLDVRKTNLCKEGQSTVSAKRQTEYCARSQDTAIEFGSYWMNCNYSEMGRGGKKKGRLSSNTDSMNKNSGCQLECTWKPDPERNELQLAAEPEDINVFSILMSKMRASVKIYFPRLSGIGNSSPSRALKSICLALCKGRDHAWSTICQGLGAGQERQTQLSISVTRCKP